MQLNQFNWPADMALANASVSGDATLLQRDFPQYLNNFLDHAHRRGAEPLAEPQRRHGLPLPAERAADRGEQSVGTSEYANIVFHALDDYAPAVAGGHAAARRQAHVGAAVVGAADPHGRLDARRLPQLGHGPRLPALAPHALLGVRARRPQHARRGAGPRRPGAALGALDVRPRAGLLRAPAGRAATPPRSPRRSTASAPRRPTRSPTRSSSPPASPALVAHQALARAADAPAEQPPPLFAYDPGSRRLAVTTPRYSAAVVDQTIRLGYGGVDLARLYDGRGHPLGSIGSHDRTGFGVAIARRKGRRLLETQGGHRSAGTFRSGKPLRGAFSDADDDRDRPRRAPHARQGPPHVPRRPHRHDLRPARPAQRDRAHPASPSGRASAARRARSSRAPRRGTLAIRVRQPAGGYRAIVRSRSRLGTHWSVIRHPPRSSPGTRGVLEVRLRLAHKRARPSASRSSPARADSGGRRTPGAPDAARAAAGATTLSEVKTFGRLLGFLRPYRRSVVLSGLLATAAMAMTVAIPALTGRAIDQIRAGRQGRT